jgi:hypothetical protein
MPMQLTAQDGSEFELAVIQDEFPELQDDAKDSRWLTISFRASTPDGETFEETAPCMNVYEAQNLAAWLRALGDGRPEIGELEFLEPNLRFSVEEGAGTEEEVLIRVGFHLEARPEWAVVDPPTSEVGWIDLLVTREQAAAAAEELKQDLEELLAWDQE